jgi:hypothetical protein
LPSQLPRRNGLLAVFARRKPTTGMPGWFALALHTAKQPQRNG